MDSDFILDCSKDMCPMPMVKAAKKISQLETGQILEVISGDRNTAQDMPAWCKNTGHEFIEAKETREGLMRIVIRKGSRAF